MHKLYTVKSYSKTAYILSLILLSFTLSGCGRTNSTPSSPGSSLSPQSASSQSASDSSPSDKADTTSVPDTAPATQGSRDNTPECLVPSADGSVTDGNELVTLDLSHTDCGYFMAQYLGTNNKVKMQVTGPNDVTYTYNLGTDFEVGC